MLIGQCSNVSFAYPAYDAFSNKPRTILREICCDFLPGSLTLIVGRNGSGKSTLLKLMSGIYTPTSGDLLLDDCPLRSFREDDLRQAIYRVPQEPQIYPLSLRENLQIGLAQPPDQASLARAVKEAGIADLVGSLRDGFDTLMGPLEQSRSSCYLIADELCRTRTIVRLEHSDVRLLLVDEPASALDPVAELDFCTKLRNSSKGRTVVVVSHRFAQLAKRADMILCMKDGKIVERGTHEELMGVGGEYWELYNAQHASD
ncbi:P-loop containing nucleoside triphosphate hydrolase protein [Gloeophyllum trabeum ATCC 11539]|uniref:p-loop containing nucleoside triphosphate hydrolase protein n=1 Tax=Gloeophyllum trabeum (strain ATCC 11539 / FP-39264 / Madison 617) TaxID=670483 RepID=S7QEG8_GLOTA|nr:P-loop containing nucleoside triphosphate hydrolase protein [Gloeophyllum trabeum ATCC 11539]EPQ57703.1 P-loop containing nucleoside triphosphate hydrolase protein [Gloeophyllum trabeum ATCC 11539]